MQKIQKKISQRSTEKRISSSKQFWNPLKPLLTNKGCMSNDFISIRNGNVFIDKESELVEMFNTHYLNIVEKALAVPPENYVIDTNNSQEIIEGIIKKYGRHPSILTIKENFVSFVSSDFAKADVVDMNALLKQIDPKKSTGPDAIHSKLVKMSANVIDKHLCNMINMDVDKYNVPDNTKVATVRPLYKKKSRDELQNYTPVSLLNAFSNILFHIYFSYSSNHVLIRQIENRKKIII